MTEVTIDKPTARNSELRNLSKGPLEAVAAALHKIIPGLSPNHITGLGLAGIAALCWETLQQDTKHELTLEQTKKLVVIYFATSATDAMDGALARYLMGNGGDHDSEVGQLVDTGSDRIQEFLLSILAMLRANHHQDKLWMTTATLTALTNPLTSLSRALAESSGQVVPEGGKSLLEFFGTRMGRFLLSAVHFMPRKEIAPGVSVQAAVDGLMAIANLKTTLTRLKHTLAKDEDGDETNPKIVEDAKTRVKVLGALTLLTTIGTILLIKKTSSDKKN